jgi:hypothetical protein
MALKIFYTVLVLLPFIAAFFAGRRAWPDPARTANDVARTFFGGVVLCTPIAAAVFLIVRVWA